MRGRDQQLDTTPRASCCRTSAAATLGPSQDGRRSKPEFSQAPHRASAPRKSFCERIPHLSILNRSAILTSFLPQDDATVKCWGLNEFGQLGLGHKSNRGDDVNGPFPSEHHHRVSRAGPACPHSCSRSPRAEMGSNLSSVDLGAGRTAVAVSAGSYHTCALLVRMHSGRSGGRNLHNRATGPHTQSHLLPNLSRHTK